MIFAALCVYITKSPVNKKLGCKKDVVKKTLLQQLKGLIWECGQDLIHHAWYEILRSVRSWNFLQETIELNLMSMQELANPTKIISLSLGHLFVQLKIHCTCHKRWPSDKVIIFVSFASSCMLIKFSSLVSWRKFQLLTNLSISYLVTRPQKTGLIYT